MPTRDQFKAVVVELIRRLWDRGLLSKTNPLAVATHDNWFEFWVDWKTERTMRDVDAQIDPVLQEWLDAEPLPVDNYLLSETMQGETPLGGEMRVTARWQAEEDA